MEQVEFANVILLNKIDLVSEAEKESVMKVVKTLNPKAKVFTTEYGVIDLKHILNSNLFNMEDAQQSPGWLVSLQKGATPESDEYGISSFVYEARKPFHPARLAEWVRRIFHFSQDWNEGNNLDNDSEQLTTMNNEFGQILRSKGFCWLGGRDELQASWALSGRLLDISPLRPWYCTEPEEEWGTDVPEELEELRKNFSGAFGDRRQAIVFIGTDLKRDAITSSLNDCLLTDEEMKRHSLTAKYQYTDHIPAWTQTITEPGNNFRIVLKKNQSHKFHVSYEGLLLNISNLALHCPLEVENHPTYESIYAKVWLEKGEGQDKESLLLATLRPEKCEQFSISADVTDNENTHWLRLEVNARTPGQKRSRDGEPVHANGLKSALEAVEVHVSGLVGINPGFEEGGEEEEEEGGACGLMSDDHHHGHEQ